MTDTDRVLADVYEDLDTAHDLLYRLLRERDAAVNISHRVLPSWDQHVAFVGGRPYEAWYLIQTVRNPVGSIYLTSLGEIGVFVLEEHRGSGHGRWAIDALMKRHPRERYLANINPRNARSFTLFESLGFRTIQHTLELRPAEGDLDDTA